MTTLHIQVQCTGLTILVTYELNRVVVSVSLMILQIQELVFRDTQFTGAMIESKQRTSSFW